MILAHSNESEWQTFRNNKHNEAFLDRIYIVKVPYCLQVSEEVCIYEKLLRHSSLAQAPCAPGTLDMMAQFSVLTRLKEPENSSIYSKLRVYDGESLKDVDPKAKALQEYKDYAGTDEGMTGVSTRFAYKILSSVFNYDQTEVAANPVHLMYVLEQRIAREDFPRKPAGATWNSSRAIWLRATPNSSARKSRRPTWSRIRNTDRTFSTGT